jgi:hypothetical protein
MEYVHSQTMDECGISADRQAIAIVGFVLLLFVRMPRAGIALE